MLRLLPWVRFEIGDSQWMDQIGWPLLFVAFLLVASLYLWSYLSRTFDQIRGSEGKYFDRDVANYLEKMAKLIIIIVLVLWLLFLISSIWIEFRVYVMDPMAPYVADLVMIIFIFMVAMLLVRILRRVAISKRGEAGQSRKGLLQVSLMLLSYFVYVLAFVIAIIIIAILVFNVDVYTSSVRFLEKHGGPLTSVFVMILAIYFFSKLVEEILEDYKFRSKRFNPQVIDLFKRAIGYILWTIAFLTITYILFSIFNLQDIGLLVIGLFLFFIFFGLALSYHTVRNIFCGLALMGPSIYDINERIRIEDDLQGDVIQKNLMFTEIRQQDGTFVNIPNVRMIDAKVHNISRSGRVAVEAPFKIDFATPFDDVRKYVAMAVEKVEGLAKDIPFELLAQEIEGNEIRYVVRIHVENIGTIEKARSDLIIYMQEAFHSAGIEKLY